MTSRFKLKRVERGLSQMALALETEIAPWRVSQIERGVTVADDDERRRLSKALGVSMDWLFADLPDNLPWGWERQRKRVRIVKPTASGVKL